MKFKIVKKKVLAGKDAGTEKYCPQMVKGQTVDFDKMAEMIEKVSAMSRGDILSVLDQMATTAVWMLQEGHAVRFGSLGIFTPSAKVKMKATADEVEAEDIEKLRVRFRPSSELNEKMQKGKKNIDK